MQKLCRECDKCQRTNHQLQKPRSELHPIPVTKVWHRVGIDLVGPLPVTEAGNKYIITLSDYFSKWPEAAPLPSKEASGVAKFLFDTFCRHGWPKIVQSDQGREFINEINACFFELTNIKHCISSAYHPQTNGLDERFNQTLMNTLKKVVDTNNSDWDLHIPSALYAYRVSRQASLKFSPFFIMYNRYPRKAVTFEMDKKIMNDGEISEDEEDGNIDDIMDRMLELRKCCHGKAKENITTTQIKQKKQYDKKHNSFKVRAIYIIIEITYSISKKTEFMTLACRDIDIST